MKTSWLDGFVLIVVVVSIGVALVLLHSLCFPNGDEQSVTDAIVKLQPRYQRVEAEELAGYFIEAANVNKERPFDPLLLVSIAMRESSLLPEAVGQLGEIGLLQVHGVALRFLPSGCTIEEPRCQLLAGAGYLDYVREVCGGSTWKWVAAYGMSRCPSEEMARNSHSVILAYRYYVSIGGLTW